MRISILALAIAVALGVAGVSLAGVPRAAGPHWVASWAASPSDASRTQPSLDGQTVRMIVAPHLGGQTLRVHLSNRFGRQPIVLDHVTVGLEADGAALVAGSQRPVTFGGAAAVTIAAGQDAVSDPVDLTFAAFQNLAVSVYVAGTIANPTEHRLTRQTNYLSPAGSGDHASDGAATAFTQTTAGTFSNGWYFLDGIDVQASASAGAIVTLGDSITDGYRGNRSPGVESTAGIDKNVRYPDYLARRVIDVGSRMSVVNAGIGGNQILKGGGTGGPSAIARLRSDAINQAGVTDVIVLEGINDLGLAGASANQVNTGLKRIVMILHQAGLRVQLGTITPAEGTASKSGRYGSAATNKIRTTINTWIRRQRYSDGVIDFDRAVRDPARPGHLKPAYDGSDHLHLSAAGYRAMAAAIPLGLLGVRAPG